MPYDHYAQNPETGEYVGWDGAGWQPVHPREVPGTTAYTALQRQPQMQDAERRMQRGANPTFLDKVGSVVGGLADTTVRAAAGTGDQFNEYAQQNPIKTGLMNAVLPGSHAVPVLWGGLKEGVKARGTDMGESIGEGNYLRAAGDAIAIATAPVGGTMFADVADVIREDPYKALGQAGGIAATFAAPGAVRAGMEATGPIGRSMQRSAAKRGALAVGARRLPEIESLYKVDDAGRPQGPIVDLLDSDAGLPVASSPTSLRNKLVARDKSAGAAVGETKSAVQPGQYVLDSAQVENTLLKSIDAEIAKRTNTIGGRKTLRPDGRPMGRTTADTTAIDNLEAARQDILSSVDSTTGKLDLSDLFGKIDTWDNVYESARVQAGGKLPITSREFTDKLAADSIRRTLGDEIPGLADVNREFHAVRTTRDVLEKHIDATPQWFGPRAKRYMAYLAAGGAAGGVGLPMGAAVAGGAAALETIGAILQSTPMRTWTANRLHRFGRLLEGGELQQAAQVAREAQASVGTAARQLPDAENLGVGMDNLPIVERPGAINAAATESVQRGSASPYAWEANPTTSRLMTDLADAIRTQRWELADNLAGEYRRIYGTEPPVNVGGPYPAEGGVAGLLGDGGLGSQRMLPPPSRALPPALGDTPQFAAEPPMLPAPSPQSPRALPPAPVDALPDGGLRLRAPINPGETVFGTPPVRRPVDTTIVGRPASAVGPPRLPNISRAVPDADAAPLRIPRGPDPQLSIADRHAELLRGRDAIIDTESTRMVNGEQAANPRGRKSTDPVAPAAPAAPDVVSAIESLYERGDSPGSMIHIPKLREAMRGQFPDDAAFNAELLRLRREGKIDMQSSPMPTPDEIRTGIPHEPIPDGLDPVMKRIMEDRRQPNGTYTAVSTRTRPAVPANTDAASTTDQTNVLQMPDRYQYSDNPGINQIAKNLIERARKGDFDVSIQPSADDIEGFNALKSRRDALHIEVGGLIQKSRRQHLTPLEERRLTGLKSELDETTNDYHKTKRWLRLEGPTSAKQLPKIDPAVQLGDRPKAPIKPVAAKPTATATAPATPPTRIDYSKMSEADLRSELSKATRARDTARKIGAGSNMFRKAEDRVKEIENAIKAGPKRISINRKGVKIEGILARTFNTRDGRRAIVLRADDSSERLVFDSEIT